MQPDDETMAGRIQADDLREQQPEHVHPVAATGETLADRVESDQLDRPAGTGSGRHLRASVEGDDTLAERMESDQIDE
ncbi:MAG TPA: hypothetical protein VIK43_02410 [Cellulomonas sp.]